MEPRLGSKWRHKKRGTEYEVVRTITEDMASRCKDGEVAYLWEWTDAQDGYGLISPTRPRVSHSVLFHMRLPLTVQLEDDTSRYGVIVMYQDLNDHRLWARYADEFLDGRFEKICEGPDF